LYQGSLLLPEKCHLLSWILFAFWQGLSPERIFAESENSLHYVQSWKASAFFYEPFAGKLDFAQNAWMDLRHKFNESNQAQLLTLFNALEAICVPVRFEKYEDQQFVLQKIAYAQAEIILDVLATEDPVFAESEYRSVFRAVCLASTSWSLLKLSSKLIPENRILIALEDLRRFSCYEEDLVANLHSKNVKELSNFELNRVQEQIADCRRSISASNKKLKDLVVFFTAYISDEIRAALSGGWTVASASLPVSVQARPNWFIKGLTKLSGAS
jgi:hypothetical protein